MTGAPARLGGAAMAEVLEPEEEPQLVPVGEPVPEPAVLAEEPVPLAEVAHDFDELDVDMPRVAILVSAKDDLLTMERATTELERRGIRSEDRVLPADSEPEALAQYTENAQLRGIRVLIAGAGPHARLPEAVTAHTRLPVIGVPLTSAGAGTDDLEGLLAQAPERVDDPVAWVALDDAAGAAALAARILGA